MVPLALNLLRIIVFIVSGYLAQINFKSSVVYLRCNRKTARVLSVPAY